MAGEMSKGERTKDRIMDLAETAILEKGFAGTSIDELIAGADITKSGFLYHFKDKSDLAKHLLKRYIVKDNEIFEGLFDRADELSDDPLHSMLIFMKLFAEMFDDLPETHPGCLAAAFSYQDYLFDNEVRELNKQGFLAWRMIFLKRFKMIDEVYSNKGDVDLIGLSDYITNIIEGGIILSRSLNDKSILPQQILMGRDYIKRIFSN